MQKGNQYIRLSDTGKVDTVGLKKATKFTLDEARRTKLKAPVKTKGFEIREQPLKDTKEKKKLYENSSACQREVRFIARQMDIAEFAANLFRSILLR